jgi:hypothetical protein
MEKDRNDENEDRFRAVREQMTVRGDRSDTLRFKHTMVHGIPFPPVITQERIDELQGFQPDDRDTYLWLYPKSGTYWISHIVRLVAKPEPGPPGLLGNDVPFLGACTLEQIRAFPSPRYMYTHLRYEHLPRRPDRSPRRITVIRNPRDVAVSYFHFMRLLAIFEWDGDWDEFLGYFMDGTVAYGSYFDWVLEAWNQRDDDRLLVLRYEDMKRDLPRAVRQVAEFLDKELGDAEIQEIAARCTFEAMKKDPTTNLDQFGEVMYVPGRGSHTRKGAVGDWRSHFTPEQLAAFDELCARKLGGSGLEFDYEAG